MKGKFLVEMTIEEFNEYNEWLNNMESATGVFIKSTYGYGLTYEKFHLLSKDEALIEMAKQIGELTADNTDKWKTINKYRDIMDSKRIKYE